MRTNAKSRGFLLTLFLLMLGTTTKAQVGHVLQGVGGVNMSMGGAATAQPLDINGALLWNPASLSKFDGQILSFNAGLFFSDPSISSTVPTQNGPFSGTTGDDRGVSVLPALAYVWGKDESKHTFGISAFGVSGFGVTFPESQDNPITMPQSSRGFGHIESDYALLQLSFAYSYQLT
ncbi:MAG TPA: hydrocarbon degradation protein, partial [Arenibacter sp.]|nr:hydrocarbon degradation protein [Arenibacter sp.]